jgi:hypothetical protein
VGRTAAAGRRRRCRWRGDRRQADAGAAAADGLGHGRHHFQQQAGAVLDAAAVVVGAVVGAGLEELVDQVAVGGVDLDAVEAGADGVLRGVAVGLHDARDLSASSARGSEVSTKVGTPSLSSTVLVLAVMAEGATGFW